MTDTKTSKLIEYRVRFYVSDCHEGVVLAQSEEDAIAKVEAWHLHCTPIPAGELVQDFRVEHNDFEDPSVEDRSEEDPC